MMKNLSMVDLNRQLNRIRPEIDKAIDSVLSDSSFIKGEELSKFESNLAKWLGVKHALGCANGTDALQLAFMALGLKRGDEVLVPTFTYVATAEVIALLGLTPVLVDVYPNTFNINVENVRGLITTKTKAIVPVHLFGQCADMERILNLAREYDLYVIEDTAQAIGSYYTFSDGTRKMAGTIGHIGTTSFFPSKNLGCYGDGGALMTNDNELFRLLKMIANHGQKIKYYHDVVGVNSRLDTIQAAILNVKLPLLNSYCSARNQAADFYDNSLKEVESIETPFRSLKSTHVFHQYTIKVKKGKTQRDGLKDFLKKKGIPSMVYYPLPLHHQKAYQSFFKKEGYNLSVSEQLCNCVLSLPMHTELNQMELEYISNAVIEFFNKMN